MIKKIIKDLFSFLVLVFVGLALFDLFEKIRDFMLLFGPMEYPGAVADPREKAVLIIKQLMDLIIIFSGCLVISGWYGLIAKKEEDKAGGEKKIIWGFIICFVAIIFYMGIALSINNFNV